MKPETIDTITRHLKGIVAALEKEKGIRTTLDDVIPPETTTVVTYMGKQLNHCTDDELRQASKAINDIEDPVKRYNFRTAVLEESSKRTGTGQFKPYP